MARFAFCISNNDAHEWRAWFGSLVFSEDSPHISVGWMKRASRAISMKIKMTTQKKMTDFRLNEDWDATDSAAEKLLHLAPLLVC
jgi:hypothetical protein